MDVEMRMPDLATTGSPIKVLRWLVDVGQSVRRGQPLLEVETDKAVMQVESVVSGRLSSVSAGEGDEVEAGKLIAIFETDRAGVAVGVEEARPRPPRQHPTHRPPATGIPPTRDAVRRSSRVTARPARGAGGARRSRARTIGPERSP
jgi:pyruvate dehydrogenase E2 component (dihydrolipoamide acetyltransferase)